MDRECLQYRTHKETALRYMWVLGKGLVKENLNEQRSHWELIENQKAHIQADLGILFIK